MLTISCAVLPSINMSLEIIVPGSDSPYLPGAGSIPFQVSKVRGTYPPQLEYRFSCRYPEQLIVADTVSSLPRYRRGTIFIDCEF